MSGLWKRTFKRIQEELSILSRSGEEVACRIEHRTIDAYSDSYTTMSNWKSSYEILKDGFHYTTAYHVSGNYPSDLSQRPKREELVFPIIDRDYHFKGSEVSRNLVVNLCKELAQVLPALPKPCRQYVWEFWISGHARGAKGSFPRWVNLVSEIGFREISGCPIRYRRKDLLNRCPQQFSQDDLDIGLCLVSGKKPRVYRADNWFSVIPDLISGSIASIDLLIEIAENPQAFTIPKAKPGNGMSRETADKIARQIGEKNPEFANHPNTRKWAEAVGCSQATISKTDYYKERREFVKEQHPRKPRAISLTESHLDQIGEDDITLQELMQEQEADYEPSPLEEGDAPQPKVYKKL